MESKPSCPESRLIAGRWPGLRLSIAPAPVTEWLPRAKVSPGASPVFRIRGIGNAPVVVRLLFRALMLHSLYRGLTTVAGPAGAQPNIMFRFWAPYSPAL